MTDIDKLREELDYIAGRVARIGAEHALHELGEVADRLCRLLDDRNIVSPPLTSERVPLHQVIGRRLPGCDWDIDGVDFDAEAATFVGLRRDDGWAPSEQAAIDPDGTVEVLVKDTP